MMSDDEDDQSVNLGSIDGEFTSEMANKSANHNLSLEKSMHQRNMIKSPLSMTPMQNLVVNMKQRLEAQLGDRTPMLDSTHDKTSPGLAHLRNTPSKCLIV